jgi:hypothetical protein
LLAVLQEPGESERLNVGVMKELSGGDTIICRALYSDPEFRPVQHGDDVTRCPPCPTTTEGPGAASVSSSSGPFVTEPTKPNEFEMDPT